MVVMAAASSLIHSYGVTSSQSALQVEMVKSSATCRRLDLGVLIARGFSCANCSIRSTGTMRSRSYASNSAREKDMETDIIDDNESNQMEELGPSFRFMAEGNMWLLEFGASGLRVLADPWLAESLTFWEQPWLYSGLSESRRREEFPGDLTWDSVNSVDAIIISQGWEDHCHIPTLKLLRKDLPVIASPNAANIVQQLGFTDVRSVAHGTCTQIPGLQVWATVGGRVGPPWALRENGFVLQEDQTGLRIYYEPHCSFDEESVQSVSPVDVVITPGRQYKVAGFPLTESVDEAVRLLCILNPKLVLPIQLTHLETSGVTTPLLQMVGSVDDFAAALHRAGLKTRCEQNREEP